MRWVCFSISQMKSWAIGTSKAAERSKSSSLPPPLAFKEGTCGVIPRFVDLSHLGVRAVIEPFCFQPITRLSLLESVERYISKLAYRLWQFATDEKRWIIKSFVKKRGFCQPIDLPMQWQSNSKLSSKDGCDQTHSRLFIDREQRISTLIDIIEEEVAMFKWILNIKKNSFIHLAGGRSDPEFRLNGEVTQKASCIWLPMLHALQTAAGSQKWSTWAESGAPVGMVS